MNSTVSTILYIYIYIYCIYTSGKGLFCEKFVRRQKRNKRGDLGEHVDGHKVWVLDVLVRNLLKPANQFV